MRFKYIGSGDSDPQEIEAYGVKFELGGAAQDVEDAAAIKKLQGNSHFETVKGRPPKAKDAD